MKLLVDINVLLDALLRRHPWSADAGLLVAAVERGQAEGFLAGHTLTTAHYLLAKAAGRQHALACVRDLLRLFTVVPVGQADFLQALTLGLRDFEDAVQAVCALKVGAEYIVTRNEKDFEGVPVAVRNAGEVLALI